MPEAFVIPKRAMAIFAHPDDVDFGCSGTLGSWIATAGTHVTYCVITSGQKGTHDPKASPEEMAALRAHRSQVGGRSGFAERMRWWAKNTGSTWKMDAAEAFRFIELA